LQPSQLAGGVPRAFLRRSSAPSLHGGVPQWRTPIHGRDVGRSSRSILRRVPILLVTGSTMETIDAVDRSCGKARFGEPEKLEAFTHLLEENVDGTAIHRALGPA